MEASDPLIDVMRLSLDPDLKAMAKNMDFRGFLRQMRDRGLVTAGRYSSYRRHVQEVLTRDQAAFKQTFKSILAAAPHLAESIERDERLNALAATLEKPGAKAAELPSETQSAVAMAAVVVVIAAAVVTYVSVAVGVTVAITAGFSISVAVSTGVVVSGGGGGCGAGRDPVCPILLRVGAHERETRRAAAAKLLGRPDLAGQTIRADIDSQLAAITQAAIDLQLLQIPAGRRADFDRHLRNLAYDAAGVAA